MKNITASSNLLSFEQTHDEFYYKMYYYLLYYNINPFYTYNVYLDIKDTLSACKVRRLREILNVKLGVFLNVQNIRSHESLLMQLADFYGCHFLRAREKMMRKYNRRLPFVA